MKVTENVVQKLTVGNTICSCVTDDIFLLLCSIPILVYNLAFVFQGTVGRRNTKLRNESVICLYIFESYECRG